MLRIIQARGSSFDYGKFAVIHLIEKRIQASASRSFFCLFVREYVLIYGYIKHDDKIEKQFYAWILPIVFDSLNMSWCVITTWHHFTVDYILNNERYIGDALLQKKYTTQQFPFKKERNTGQRPQ